MIKNCKYYSSTQPIKFNRVQIKLDLDGIVLSKKSYVSGIFLITDHNIDSTSFWRITRKKLSSKKQYFAQRVRSAYTTSIC